MYHNIPIVYLVKSIYTQSHIYRSISIPTAINRNRSPFLKMYDETVSEMSVAQGFTGEGLTPKEIDKVLDDKIQEVSEIKPFSYNNEPGMGQRPPRIVNENPQNFGRLKDDFNKIDML